MLRLKCTERLHNSVEFKPMNDVGQSKDFWPIGVASAKVHLFDCHPVTAAMFEEGKEYEVIIHERHAPITKLISPK